MNKYPYRGTMWWLAAFGLAAAALVAAAGAGAKSNAAGAKSHAAAKVTTLGFASPEKPNDFGWNQQGYLSAQKAAKATGASFLAVTGIGYENTEPALRRLAQRGADFIIAHASGYSTIGAKVAQQLKVPFLAGDSPPQPGYVSAFLTKAEQGAYLAGVLAAQVTKTATLGIVVSASTENWYLQAGGFVAGARSITPGLKFRYARIGQASYADAAGGKRVTQQVIATGADVVFGMGDGSSFGMLQAVETAKPPSGASKVFFIDVIGDKQKLDKKGVLLSSVIWDFTPIFTQAIKDVNNGKFGNAPYVLTVKNGLSLLKTNKAPAAAWARVAKAQNGIASGSITVPVTPTEGAVKKLCQC